MKGKNIWMTKLIIKFVKFDSKYAINRDKSKNAEKYVFEKH